MREQIVCSPTDLFISVLLHNYFVYSPPLCVLGFGEL